MREWRKSGCLGLCPACCRLGIRSRAALAGILGERRPVDERERTGKMLRNANLVITAWDGDVLVSISRSATDFAYCTYLSDLAVRLSHQRQRSANHWCWCGSPKWNLALR